MGNDDAKTNILALIKQSVIEPLIVETSSSL